VNAEDFSRFLNHRLCWLDAFPTHHSSASQRQCPHCRTKWSFLIWDRRWRLAEAWAKGLSRKEAAAQCGADVHTVSRIFRDIEKQVAWEYIERMRMGEDGMALESDRIGPACARLRQLTSQAGVMRELAAFTHRNMSVEERMEDVFLLCFLDDLRDMIARARMRLADWDPLSVTEE